MRVAIVSRETIIDRHISKAIAFIADSRDETAREYVNQRGSEMGNMKGVKKKISAA